MYRLLIAEDDKDIARLMQIGLVKAGYEVEVTYDGDMAADLLERGDFSMALLDIMLPGLSGYDLIDYTKTLSIPTIFITAKGSIADKTKGFHLGADDYIVKPFIMEEVVLRVENVLRLHGLGSNVLRCKDIELDTNTRTVRRAGNPVQLTPKEYDLFLVLMRNKNTALYRYALYEKVWGDEYDEDTRTLDIHIRRLRQKLGLKDEIKTVYRVGYMLETDS